ncbi:hypothetical protein GCM10008934_03630 [Virgibacillus salarius]
MGVTFNSVFWLILRLVSGISSGLVFVLASGIVLETLEAHKRQSLSGIFYGSNALYGAFTAQILGVILPVLTHSAVGVFLGAFLFEGTFMGITTLTVSKGESLSFQNSNKTIGYLTASYGIGQIIGPIIAGMLTYRTSDYNGALIFASVILLVGIILLYIGNYKQVGQKEAFS